MDLQCLVRRDLGYWSVVVHYSSEKLANLLLSEEEILVVDKSVRLLKVRRDPGTESARMAKGSAAEPFLFERFLPILALNY